MRILGIVALLSAAALSPTVQAQSSGAGYIFAVPGTGSAASRFIAYPYASTPLAPTVDRSGPPGVNRILAKADGSKFYFIGSGASGLQSIDSTLSTFGIVNGLPSAPTAVAITPDGRYLIVGAGDVYIVDTVSNAILGTGLGINGTIQSIAVSPDSSTAWALSNLPASSSIVSINLAARTRGNNPLQLPFGGATSLTVSPTGLLYVSSQNAVYEIDPATFQLTSSGTIALNFTPGPLRFTPDGSVAYAANLGTLGGSIVKITIASRQVSAWPPFNPNSPAPIFDDVYVAASDRVFAYSSANATIYDVSTTALAAAPSALSAVLANSPVLSIALSNEIPTVRYLYALTSGGTINRITLANNNLSGSIPSITGSLAFAAAPPQSGGTSYLQINGSQTLAASATSAPLIVYLLDGTGRPVYNQTVNFTADNQNGPTVNTPSVITNANGFAQTTVRMPTTPGTYTVTANAGGVTSTFTLTIPGGTTGGGTGVGTGTGAQITALPGNGPLIQEFNFLPTYAPLAVKVTDANGNPLANAAVSFTHTGTVLGTLTNPNAVTDSTGVATTGYVAGSISSNLAAQSTIITATASVGSVDLSLVVFHINSDNTGAPVIQLVKPAGNNGPTITGAQGSTVAGAISAVVSLTNFPQVGAPLPGVGLRFFGNSQPPDPSTPSNLACIGTPLSDQLGTVSCDLVIGCAAGAVPRTDNAYVVVGEYRFFPIRINVTTGAATKFTSVSGDAQTGRPGAVLATLSATLTDACGNPIINAPITWKVTSGSATLSNTINISNSLGGTSARVTLGQTPGTVTVQVSSGAAVQNFTLTTQAVIGALTLSSGGSQTAFPGDPFTNPLIFVLTDTQGRALPSFPITLSSTNATLSATSATTDSQGRISVTATAGSTVGAASVTATYTTFTANASLTVAQRGPSITNQSFYNGASFVVGLSPCSIGTVIGNGLAPNVQGTVNGSQGFGPLPYTLAGVSISIAGVATPLVSVSNTGGQQQVSFQTPCEVRPGPSTVVVNVGAGSTTVQNVAVNAAQPGIFTFIQGGKTYGVVQSAADGSYVTPTNLARRGGTYFMYVTGLGATTPQAQTNAAGVAGQNVTNTVLVGVNNAGVPVIGAQYAPGLVGVYYIVFTIPQTSQPGTDQSLVVAEQINGQTIFGNNPLLAGVQ